MKNIEFPDCDIDEKHVREVVTKNLDNYFEQMSNCPQRPEFKQVGNADLADADAHIPDAKVDSELELPHGKR